MWTVKTLTAVDDKGNSVTVVEKKITVAVKLDNGFHVTKTFRNDHTPPFLSDAVNQLIKHIHHANIN